MSEFERAVRRYKKNQERKARIGISYGPQEESVPKKVEVPKIEAPIPEKKVSPHGHITIHVRVQDLDEVLTFTVQSMAGNWPGRLTKETLDGRLRTMFSSFGRLL